MARVKRFISLLLQKLGLYSFIYYLYHTVRYKIQQSKAPHEVRLSKGNINGLDELSPTAKEIYQKLNKVCTK